MSGENLLALSVTVKNALIPIRRALFHPRQQSRAEVETDPGVVIDDLRDASFGIEYSRSAVGEIAFPRDALVPVVIRTCGVLRLNRFQPGIFPRRLIKMTMNAGKTLHY